MTRLQGDPSQDSCAQSGGSLEAMGEVCWFPRQVPFSLTVWGFLTVCCGLQKKKHAAERMHQHQKSRLPQQGCMNG